MIELPDKYDVPANSHGFAMVQEYFNSCAGRADRYILAKNIVQGKSEDELIQYIAQMLLGIETIKRKAGAVAI